MDQRQKSEQVDLDEARELLQETMEVLSRAGQPGETRGVEHLRRLIERLRKIPAAPDAA